MYWLSKDLPAHRDSAEFYLRQSIRLAEENGLTPMFIEKYKELSDLYRENGNEHAAAEWRMRYLNLVDSVYIGNARKVYDASNQQFLYEMTKDESQINNLWQEKKNHNRVISRQRWAIAGILAGMILAFLLIWCIVRKNRKLSDSYRSLFSLNKTLMQTHSSALARQRELEDENRRLTEALAQKAGNGNAVNSAVEDSQEGQAEGKEKYSSSNLSEEQTRRLERRISDAMESNSCDYCNVDFSLNVLAEHVGSNSRYVSQVINNEFGKSFSSYVNEYRIREACARLSGEGVYANYSIKGIGESVGFKSHSTFVSVFKKITGMTPSIYRKMAQS